MVKRSTFTTIIASVSIATAASAFSPADNLLAGPTIQDEEVTDQDMQSRRLQETGKKSNINARNQMKYWMSALESIELTRDQQTSIKALVEELQIKQREFQKTYGAELAKIREEQRKANNAAFAAQAAREAVNAHVLMELAPDPTSYQERAWALLTPEQQNDFRLKYQSILAEEIKKREERKAHDRPMTDEMMQRDPDRERGGAKPFDLRLDSEEKDRKRGEGSMSEDEMRRIRFLRRLQQLKQE